MKKILLDTNAYTRLMSGNTDVLDILSSAETVYFSIFVIGELFGGFAGGKNEKRNKKILEDFLQNPTARILNATIETSRIFGAIKYALKQSGTPIPINDVWIASHCLETGSTLVTFDEHFKKVPGLLLWDLA